MDLPQPDGPRSATNSPGATERSSEARTGVAEAPKRLDTASKRSAGGGGAVGVGSGEAADKAKRGVLTELSGAGRGASANWGISVHEKPATGKVAGFVAKGFAGCGKA